MTPATDPSVDLDSDSDLDSLVSIQRRRARSLSPTLNLNAYLGTRPPSAEVRRRAGALILNGEIRPLQEALWEVVGREYHRVYLGANSALCDCEAGKYDKLCAHVVAVMAFSGWLPPGLNKEVGP